MENRSMAAKFESKSSIKKFKSPITSVLWSGKMSVDCFLFFAKAVWGHALRKLIAMVYHHFSSRK